MIALLPRKITLTGDHSLQGSRKWDPAGPDKSYLVGQMIFKISLIFKEAAPSPILSVSCNVCALYVVCCPLKMQFILRPLIGQNWLHDQFPGLSLAPHHPHPHKTKKNQEEQQKTKKNWKFPLKIIFIPYYSRLFTFWTIPTFLHSGPFHNFAFWSIPEFLYSGSIWNLYILDHSSIFPFWTITEFQTMVH